MHPHLDSLNDQLAELSGVRVRETVPDKVLQRADEIVVVDVTPETLLERLRAGKVYAAPRVDAALNGFFRIENLAALREAALRQVADEVVTPGRVAVGERVLALVQPHPSAQRIVRRAWRSAQRLGAELDVLWVRSPGTKDNGLARLREPLPQRLMSATPRGVDVRIVAARREK
jgi:two-component system sensor histidine kinase KdpD